VNKFVGKTNISVSESQTFSLSQLTISDIKKMDLLASIYITSTGRP
jgi:hypothetical protein